MALSRIENVHNDLNYFEMEIPMLTVELAVDQHTKICERLDERKFMWLITAYCGGMFTLLGFLGKYLLDSYAR